MIELKIAAGALAILSSLFGAGVMYGKFSKRLDSAEDDIEKAQTKDVCQQIHIATASQLDRLEAQGVRTFDKIEIVHKRINDLIRSNGG